MGDPRHEMFRWLCSDDARAAAHAELQRRALPVALADDVIGATALAVGAADVSEVERPVAYARRVLSTKVLDLLRGRIRDRTRQTAWPDDHDFEAVGAGPASFAVATDVEDELRRALHLLLAVRKAWAGAAALTVLTLAGHPDVPLPDAAPEPDRWAALWLAGQRDCFPDPTHDEDAAMRQRRSRALRAVDAVLVEAAEAIGIGRVDV